MHFGKDVVSLTRKLLLHRDLYFSNEILNSEGRKIFEELARMIIYEHPYLKERVRRTRRKSDLATFLKLAELILGESEVREIMKNTVNYPYVSPGLDL
ncbi:MAG: hypothetical protein ABWK01_09085 [Infirmifilum sp.]